MSAKPNSLCRAAAQLPVFAIDPSTIHIIDAPAAFKQTLLAALSANPSLSLHVLVDHFRGTRKDGAGQSTSTVIQSLKTLFPNQVRLSLYRSPSTHARWLSFVPQRFNEVFGLQHIKAYIFDDSLVLSPLILHGDAI
eukprot:jgi/Hompol1/6002/HPOL_004784-RA